MPTTIVAYPYKTYDYKFKFFADALIGNSTGKVRFLKASLTLFSILIYNKRLVSLVILVKRSSQNSS